jgi:hypothetical protein
VAIRETHAFRTAADLVRLLPAGLPDPFSTQDLAQGLGVARWFAQRIAYCLRQTGAARAVGKQGNTHLYSVTQRRRHTG